MIKIEIHKGKEHLGEALESIPKNYYKRDDNVIYFTDNDYSRTFFAKLCELRGDPPVRKQGFNSYLFGRGI